MEREVLSFMPCNCGLACTDFPFSRCTSNTCSLDLLPVLLRHLTEVLTAIYPLRTIHDKCCVFWCQSGHFVFFLSTRKLLVISSLKLRLSGNSCMLLKFFCLPFIFYYCILCIIVLLLYLKVLRSVLVTNLDVEISG